jgi:hypothetical protein
MFPARGFLRTQACHKIAVKADCIWLATPGQDIVCCMRRIPTDRPLRLGKTEGHQLQYQAACPREEYLAAHVHVLLAEVPDLAQVLAAPAPRGPAVGGTPWHG